MMSATTTAKLPPRPLTGARFCAKREDGYCACGIANESEQALQIATEVIACGFEKSLLAIP